MGGIDNNNEEGGEGFTNPVVTAGFAGLLLDDDRLSLFSTEDSFVLPSSFSVISPLVVNVLLSFVGFSCGTLICSDDEDED